MGIIGGLLVLTSAPHSGVVGLAEPDCSPHPFDTMAIEALYQTVSP